jgi:hypothetical protein
MMPRRLATALLFAMITATAQAMPLAPIDSQQESDVVRIAGGCGPGWHRGPYGGCLRNFANPAAHACPRGFHIGPYGGCRGNGR